jgi:predicted nucleotide-binding protein
MDWPTAAVIIAIVIAVPSAIFLVHGRDRAAKFEVARWLEQRVGADVVILDEQAHRGRTIIEKFQDHADADKVRRGLADAG